MSETKSPPTPEHEHEHEHEHAHAHEHQHEAPVAREALAGHGSSGLVYTGLYLAGMLVLFVGERLLGDSAVVRIVLAAVGLSLLLGAVAGRAVRRARVPRAAARVETWILLAYAGGLLALILYGAQADFAMDRVRAMVSEARAADRYAGALAALWPVVWVCAMVPLLLMELSYGPMDLRRTVEPTRVGRSAQSGLVLAMTLSGLFMVNFLSSELNQKVDLSYFKTTRPSESSMNMVKNLSEPLEVVLFYPGANEVQEQVEGYFTELARASDRVTVRRVDHVLEPKLAKAYSVSNNGYIVLVKGKDKAQQHESINVGTDLERAKVKLKRLDSEFQSAFSRLSRAQKVAYFTVGHEERSGLQRDGRKGTSIRDMRETLTQLNYLTRDLGLGQGLGSDVPGDATLVVIVGPTKPLLPAEVASLHRYLVRGGRLLLMLDPEAGLDFAELLGPLGLKFDPVVLANDKAYVRITHTQADRHFLYSNRFSSHPSVGTVSRNAHRMATVMLGAGALSEIPPTEGLGGKDKPKVLFTVHSVEGTWNDKDRDAVFDPKEEKRAVYELGAAVTMKAGGAGGGKGAGHGKGEGEDEMRVVVLGDSDLMSDAVFRNAGNGYLLLDALRWMVGEEAYIGETESEEDVRIVHTRKEDRVWFYLTIFAMPALVLAGGLLYTRRRRRTRP